MKNEKNPRSKLRFFKSGFDFEIPTLLKEIVEISIQIPANFTRNLGSKKIRKKKKNLGFFENRQNGKILQNPAERGFANALSIPNH